MSRKNKIPYKGGLYTYGELSKICGVARQTLYARTHQKNKHGNVMSIEEAMKVPVQTSKHGDGRTLQKNVTANVIYNKFLSIAWKK